MSGVQNIEKIVLPRGVTKVGISLYRHCSLSIVTVTVFFYPFEAQWLLYIRTIRFEITKFIFMNRWVLFYPMLPNFRKITAFWKVPRLRLFVLFLKPIWGHAVAQLVEAPRYKRVRFPMVSWNFSST
jgi:hypothetical protein